MALRDDFSNYIDGNGLLSPNPGTWVPGQKSSDNGTSFTSEYYTILKKNDQLTNQDKLDYQQKIGQCVNSAGMLCRVPIGQDDGEEAPDDYYGVLNGCMQMGNTIIPRQFLTALVKNWGFMDNESPGRLFNWPTFMSRQLQMVACMVGASFPSWKNPLHILIRMTCFPLFLYSAIIVATAGMLAEPSDTDNRRLSWHLWQCLKPVSPLCWLASKLWLNRLYRAYGPTGMSAIAGIYYQPTNNNPYQKWWITK
jgi:hypothetical protein